MDGRGRRARHSGGRQRRQPPVGGHRQCQGSGRSENSNLSVQYGANVKLFVDGEEQKIANLVGDYEGTFATGETVTLTFEPAVDGREIAGVTVNGEAVDFEDTDSFTYTLQAGEADELAFAFTTVDKSVLLSGHRGSQRL